MPSAAVGTGLSNYTISYDNGSLTVNTAALTITANSTSKTYGQTVTFAGTEFSETGLVRNGDTVTSVTLTAPGPRRRASGGLALFHRAQRGGGTGLSNYTISYVNGTLTVNAAPLTITPTAGQSKGYGAALPAR